LGGGGEVKVLLILWGTSKIKCAWTSYGFSFFCNGIQRFVYEALGV